mmetsp:Transcript_3634/g.5644  ORF Transcript_3634/g.5644 Transcript_3634/m.5644 type:complete len:515 (-) Transcript_3634:372-1916(-)
MGQVGEKAATVVVTLDQESVTAGSYLTGKVYLSVHKPVVDCSSLVLNIQGYEKTKVTYTTSTGTGKNRKTHRKTARSQSNFLNTFFPLAEMSSGSLPQGDYEYPFKFLVPSGLPSSMSAERGSGSCNIGYSVDARLHRDGWMAWSVQHSRHFVVVTTPPSHQCPVYMNPSVVPVNTCFCFGRGHIVSGGAVSSNMICAGESAKVNYAVINKSATEILAVDIILSEHIVWRARGHSSLCYTVLFSSSMPTEDLKDVGTPVTKPVSFANEDVLRQVRDTLLAGRHSVNISVPSNVLSSYSGDLITIRHDIVIRMRTPCGTNNPELCQPIHIFSPIPVVEVDEEDVPAKVLPSTMPENWSPVSNSLVELPVAQYAPPSEVDPEDVYRPLYPSVIPQEDGMSGLVATLRESFDQTGKIKAWFSQNSADNISPGDFYSLFVAVRNMFDQISTAEILADSLSKVTCEQLAEAARGADDICRRDVVEKIAKAVPIVDRENSAVVQNQLTHFQFTFVEKYFL